MMEILLGNIGIIMVALIAIAVIGAGATVAKNRHNVAPNQVAVVSGRGSGDRGYRVITGGGFTKIPLLERIDYLYLNVMSFNVQVNDVPDKKGVLVDVTGVANVKIMGDAQNLPLAIERFLGKPPAEIQAIAKENLESNLRGIVGTMTIEELNSDRNTLQTQVMKEAASDLGKLGLGIDVLNIQQVTDKKGYIAALGKARTAEVVRDAAIGEANAQKTASIAQSLAAQESQEAKAKAEQAISEANRERDLVMAANAARVQAEQARIPVIAEAAATAEQKKLVIAQVEVQKSKAEEETKLQEFVAKRNRAEQAATTLVTAQATADAKVITAKGTSDAAVMEGEALRVRDEKAAQGRQALAGAIRAEGEAEAAATRARLLAEAAGIEAKGIAEATAIEKKADAYAKLQESGITLMLMEASPTAIRAVGDAVGAALKPAAEAIGHGMAAIDEVKVFDMGGSSNGKGVLNQLSQTPVELIFSMVEKAKAMGLGPVIEQALGAAGIKVPVISAGTTNGSGESHTEQIAS